MPQMPQEPLGAESTAWLSEQVARFWSPGQTPEDCHPCRKSWFPQIKSGPLEGRSLIRICWSTHHQKQLGGHDQLTRTCATKWCGNVNHWICSAERAQQIRSAWFSGQYETVQQLVDETGVKVGRRMASHVIERKRCRYAPLVKTERQLHRQGLVEQPESAREFQTTGRIIGPDGTIYCTIRDAERASGIDRTELAIKLNRKLQTGWRYEPGEFHHTYAMWGDQPDKGGATWITKFPHLSGRKAERELFQELAASKTKRT